MKNHVKHQVALILIRYALIDCIEHFLSLKEYINTLRYFRLNLCQRHRISQHCRVSYLADIAIDPFGHVHGRLGYGNDLLILLLRAHAKLLQQYLHLGRQYQESLRVICRRKQLASQSLRPLNPPNRLSMLGQIRVLCRNRSQYLHDLRLSHMRRRCLLRQIIKIRLIHELLIL